jgi:activating signal cointegrator complex subunit 3
MIDVCAERGWLATTLHTQQIMQMVIQARWVQDSPLLTLPHLEPHHMYLFTKKGVNLQTLPGLRAVSCKRYSALADILRGELDEGEIEQVGSKEYHESQLKHTCLCYITEFKYL